MRRKIKRYEDDGNNYMFSVGDLMAGVLFIFVLLFLKEYITSDKENYKKILKEFEIISLENKKLKEMEEEFKKLKLLEEEYEKNKHLREIVEKLRLENEKYKKQDVVIENIYNEIEKKLREAIKDDEYVKIDFERQELILDNRVLFDSNEYLLKEEGKNALRRVLPKFFATFIDDNTIISYLEQLVIEGHTDDTGPGNAEEKYLYNLNLSQKRAFEVANFIYSDRILAASLGEKRLKKLKIYLSSNGKSDSNLLYKENNPKLGVDRNKSRRVTIKYKIDVQKIRKELKEVE